MEATPGNGPASATQVKPPAPARPATTAPKSGVDFTPSDVQGGRGSITSKSTSDAGVKTASSQVTGQTKTSDATGTTTTNRAGQTIEKQTPRFMGIQQTTNIDPATGKETTSTNYKGKVGGVKVNVTAPGTMDQFDLKKATNTQVGFGGVSVSSSPGSGGKPATRDLQMNFGPNQVNMTKTGNKQPTTTFKRSGKVVK